MFQAQIPLNYYISLIYLEELSIVLPSSFFVPDEFELLVQILQDLVTVVNTNLNNPDLVLKASTRPTNSMHFESRAPALKVTIQKSSLERPEYNALPPEQRSLVVLLVVWRLREEFSSEPIDKETMKSRSTSF
jgi:hypothetical protein